VREIVISGIVAAMARLSVASLIFLAGCTSPAYLKYLENADDAGSGEPASGDSSGDENNTTTGDPGPTSAGAAGSESMGTTGFASTDASATSTGDSSTSGEDEGEASSSSGGVLPPPVILNVDMPAKVSLAGPVPFTTTTEFAFSARATLDGVDIGALHDEGNGVYSGTVAIYGAVDNGDHVLEVFAEREGLSAHQPVPFEVTTPAPGTVAWAMAGPAGSRTRRNALTAERDVIEVGSLVIAGVQRPVIRKLSGLNGANLWAEGTIVLDEHEGWAVDVAVAPGGGLWVAMNVRLAPNVWRPRIVLLDAAGQFTGIEVPAEAGQTVTGIDNDGTGGCVAVGFAGSGQGDTDVVVWRMNGEHVPVLSGKSWDYQAVDQLPHAFTDIATDVVVQDGVAWIVGMSIGKHDNIDAKPSRGVVVRMDVDTAGVLGPVIIASPVGDWMQSKFVGAAAHPDGVIVTGNACDENCDNQRVETALYTAAGVRVWFRPELPAAAASGNAVALNAHGGVVIAATMKEGAALRGYLLGRDIEDEAEPFSVPFPASSENSEASAVAIDEFGRISGGGYRTLGGVIEARTILVHP
jgi:hypothetical protein